MNMPTHDHSMLRLVLRANAAFSFTSGLILAIAHQPVANFIGLQQPQVVMGIGFALLLFAAGLFFSAQRKTPNPLGAKIAVVLDLSWVVASVLIVSIGLLTRSGNWAAIVVADIVLAFAVLQYIGLRRMRAGGDGMVGDQ